MDGTLLDSLWIWKQIDIDFLARRGFELPSDYQKCIGTMNARDGAAYTIERFGLNEDPEDLMREWFEMAIELYSNTLELKPWALAFVKKLKAMGKKTAVATSSDAELAIPALRRTGVLDYLDAVVTTNEVERGKGFPDVYVEAAARIGTGIPDSVVFEDIIEGITGAASGGFATVAVYDKLALSTVKEMRENSDLHIMSFRDALNILEEESNDGKKERLR